MSEGQETDFPRLNDTEIRELRAADQRRVIRLQEIETRFTHKHYVRHPEEHHNNLIKLEMERRKLDTMLGDIEEARNAIEQPRGQSVKVNGRVPVAGGNLAW